MGQSSPPKGHTRSFIPSIGSGFFLSFIVLMSLKGWASWYPGAEPGGGEYIARRIFSATQDGYEGADVWLMIHYLPPSLRDLMLAGFAARPPACHHLRCPPLGWRHRLHATHGASIAAAWKSLLALGAGAGLVFMLRW